MSLDFSVTCMEGVTSSNKLGDLCLISGAYPKNSTVLLLVSGYNSGYSRQDEVYLQIANGIRERGIKFDSIGGFHWPGADKAWEFLNAVGRASKCGEPLAQLIRQLQARGNTVTVETHSLGARPALAALNLISVPIEAVVLTAPAVDNDVLNLDGEFARVSANAKRILVFYSNRDSVLKRWYFTAEIASWLWSRLTKKPRKALGLTGPVGSLPNGCYAYNCSSFIADHGDYKDHLYWAEIAWKGTE